MKRIFIAVDISAEARTKAADYAREIRSEFPDVRAGWERPEKMHLTLKFLGDTDEGRLNDLAERLRTVAAEFGPFDISVRGTGVFPNANRPRVLWLGVAGATEELTYLARAVDEACATVGFPREQRDHRPHLTIARVREPERGAPLAAEHLRREFDSDDFEVKSLSIVESRLGQNGSTYRVIERIAFPPMS